MEELTLITRVLEYVDVIYIFMCNIITYMVISTIQTLIHKDKIKKGMKRIISAVVGITLGLLMVFAFGHNGETVFYSFFIQFLTWDYVIKELKHKLKNRKNTADEDDYDIEVEND